MPLDLFDILYFFWIFLNILHFLQQIWKSFPCIFLIFLTFLQFLLNIIIFLKQFSKNLSPPIFPFFPNRRYF